MEQEFDKYHRILNDPQEVRDDDELSKFIQDSSSMKLPKGKSKEDIWAAIDEKTEEKSAKTPIYLSIAASLIVLIVATIILFPTANNATQQVVAVTGQHVNHILPDGSSVVLNASSKITYDQNWNRNVILEGEAFFEVVKGSTFTVETSLGTVSVLGTSFNVSTRDESLTVTCKTGKVKVDIPTSNFQEILEPGESVKKVGTQITEMTTDKEKIGIWQAGEYYFDEKPVTAVFKELERQFTLTIETEGLEEMLFSGYFINESPEVALEMICLPLALSYEFVDEQTVRVKAKP